MANIFKLDWFYSHLPSLKKYFVNQPFINYEAFLEK